MVEFQRIYGDRASLSRAVLSPYFSLQQTTDRSDVRDETRTKGLAALGSFSRCFRPLPRLP